MAMDVMYLRPRVRPGTYVAGAARAAAVCGMRGVSGMRRVCGVAGACGQCLRHKLSISKG